MGVVKNLVAIAAGATNQNVLAGSAFEFLDTDSLVEIGLLGSATGLLAGVSSGSDILLEQDSMVDVVRVANQGPLYPDDYLLTDEALQGDRLKIYVRNPTGGSINLFYGVRTTPI